MLQTLVSTVLLALGLSSFLQAEPNVQPSVNARNTAHILETVEATATDREEKGSPVEEEDLSAASEPVGSAATGELPTPLPSDLFTDRVQAGYKVAEEIPGILAGLTCYCGCDRSQGHRHLLDCFVDDHAVG